MAFLALFLACGKGGAFSANEDPLMPNLLLPPWEPTYNLTKSTMTQTCFGPARISPVGPLTNESGAFMRSWGIITIDFESQEEIWGHHPGGKNSDEMMVAEAVKAKSIAPETQVYIYRNLAQAYANFVELREKLEDPSYSDWWIPFGPNSTMPRCELNPRLNKTLCSDYFHTKLGWTENGHDCGDVLPCGDYVFNHRNQSLRKWIVETHMLGKMGIGHPAVDGFLIDDWYTKYPCTDQISKQYPCEPGQFVYGPSEIPGFIGIQSGIDANSTQMKELYGNWSITTNEALKAVRDAGGYTWSNFNCMLDTDGGYGCPPSDLAGCGLHKTEGIPRANNTETAPMWHGRLKGWDSSEACSNWTRMACDPSSVFSKIPTELAFGNDTHADVAQFLLTRGPYGYMGYGWHGCVSDPPPSKEYDLDYGEPKGLCTETAPMSGIFVREWTKATIQFDCNTMTPNITMH
eukprot:m.16103 g.16103  ORF g.16103 m.16103 type:complete len:461 (+) comp5584_c0_seq2:76-1458(+)